MSDKGKVKPSPCQVTDTAQMLGILLHVGQTAQLFEFLHRVACLVLEPYTHTASRLRVTWSGSMYTDTHPEPGGGTQKRTGSRGECRPEFGDMQA